MSCKLLGIMMNITHEKLENNMKQIINKLSLVLSKIRTDRAHPDLLNNVIVNCYEESLLLMHVATVVVDSSNSFVVTPFDKNMIINIDKAIRIADLGLNPITSANDLIIRLPSLTEERRKDLVKKVRVESEKFRVAIRNERRDFKNNMKNAFKNKEISENELKRIEDEMQKTTNNYIKKVEEIITTKELDLMKV